MASKSQSCVALLSIKPEYANAIFDGTKCVEFRKQLFLRPVQYVIVYASSPEQKVIGYFEIERIDSGKPLGMWKRYRGCGGISFADYKSYYGDSPVAVVYVIKKSHELLDPISLNKLKRGLKAPQGYYYLNDRFFQKLKQLPTA